MADRSLHVRGELRASSRAWLRFATDDRLVALIRRGDATAFEILYDRHCRELLSFCRYMLGSQHDAEDAVQATFASAYRALLADERSVAVRPWLFAIARNACLSVLRRCRPTGELDGAQAPGEDPSALVEQREDLRQALSSLLELPERQRAALVLSELHGFSHSEIGALLGVRAEQVKSYAYQARTSLISDRRAHNADCRTIREDLAAARGAALLKGHLRRHLRVCASCRDYAEGLSRRRRQLGGLLPVAPSIALKRRVLTAALGRSPAPDAYVAGTTAGASLTGAAVDLAGGGAKALVAKLLVGAACLGAGAGAGAGTLAVGAASTHPVHAPSTSSHGVLTRLRLAAAVGPAGATAPAGANSSQTARQPSGSGPAGAGGQPAQASSAPDRQRLQALQSSGANNARTSATKPGDGNSEDPPGKGGSGNPPGKSGSGNPGKGNSGNPPGKSSSGNPGKGNSEKSNQGRGNPGGGKQGNGGQGNSASGNPGHGNVSASPTSPGPPNASQGSGAEPQNATGASGSGGANGNGSAHGHGENGESPGESQEAPKSNPHKH